MAATERFQLFFSLNAVSLHDMVASGPPCSANRLIRLDRNPDLKERDANVVMLRAMADAGNAAELRALTDKQRDYDLRDQERGFRSPWHKEA